MRRKVYGESRKATCATCGEQSTQKNGQGLPCCRHHIHEEYNLKCVCKHWLDVRDGKWGVFFLCESCGPISYAKGLEMNDLPLKRIEDL